MKLGILTPARAPVQSVSVEDIKGQTEKLTSDDGGGEDKEKSRYPDEPVGFTKVDGTGEADMKESHGNDDEDACGPNSASEPKSDGRKRVQPDGIVGGTTKGLGDDLPDEDDKCENVTGRKPKVGLVSRHQLLEVRETKLCLHTTSATILWGRNGIGNAYWSHPSAQGMRGKDGNDNTKDDEY